MSRNPEVLAGGQKTFVSNCASCHGEKLTGGIGPNLVDKIWLHGGRPTAIYATVTAGVAAKGMPTWGPVLGAKKVSEVVAFIVSKHESTELEMQSSNATNGIAPARASAP
jgi:cytochrome c oxidase cbb3-type subunit 3